RLEVTSVRVVTAPVHSTDLAVHCTEIGSRAKAASRLLAAATTDRKDVWLREAADGIVASTDAIVAANARDLAAAEENGLTKAQIDRLRLTEARVAAAVARLREIAVVPDRGWRAHY